MTAQDKAPSGWWQGFNQKFVVEERYMEPADRSRLYRAAVVLAAVGTLLFLVALGSVLFDGGLAAIDEPLRNWLLGTRSELATGIMQFLAVIFGPIALPIIVLVVNVAWGFAAKHAWRPILLAGGMITGVIISQIILHLVDRARPPVELMLFGADHTYSFPSGHVLGACDFLLVGAYLIASRSRKPKVSVSCFALAAVGIVLAALSRLYLGYHWFTDAFASASLALVILGGIIALDTWRTARIPGEPITGELSTAENPADPS
ncbi:phosphatase PAP2 family protein [Pseudarthrobacter sp. J64]|uniref:phosphatase PAP2 family protein n=1 Tax=Pseudarthrobacter sp. J64 TaxID=3116485 RepID=UPI002E80BD61|nr:phosphatase PAP2 family protein [Pseudarthrobacter sp. J64]MEE2568721.1 phosphatase PAP2 family protein [Pseudarthrobacter sp. J64]